MSRAPRRVRCARRRCSRSRPRPGGGVVVDEEEVSVTGSEVCGPYHGAAWSVGYGIVTGARARRGGTTMKTTTVSIKLSLAFAAALALGLGAGGVLGRLVPAAHAEQGQRQCTIASERG